MGVERDVTQKRAYFWVDVHTETRLEDADDDAERAQVADFVTRHELGPYKYRRRGG